LHRELIAAFTPAAIETDQGMSTIADEFTPQAQLKRSVEDWNKLMQRLEVQRVHEAQKKLAQ
jgi:predicted transcriptional regulator